MISHRLIYVKSNLPKEVEMKQYKLFMDVSGDVLHEIAGDSVGLVPMEFIIDGKSYIYTDSDEGMNPIEFYQYVKQGIAIKTSRLRLLFTKIILTKRSKTDIQCCICACQVNCLPPICRHVTHRKR